MRSSKNQRSLAMRARALSEYKASLGKIEITRKVTVSV